MYQGDQCLNTQEPKNMKTGSNSLCAIPNFWLCKSKIYFYRVSPVQSLVKSPLRLTEAHRAANKSNQKSWKYWCPPRRPSEFIQCVYLCNSLGALLSISWAAGMRHTEKRERRVEERDGGQPRDSATTVPSLINSLTHTLTKNKAQL